jgi:hypothetical protein
MCKQRIRFIGKLHHDRIGGHPFPNSDQGHAHAARSAAAGPALDQHPHRGERSAAGLRRRHHHPQAQAGFGGKLQPARPGFLQRRQTGHDRAHRPATKGLLRRPTGLRQVGGLDDDQMPRVDAPVRNCRGVEVAIGVDEDQRLVRAAGIPRGTGILPVE